MLTGLFYAVPGRLRCLEADSEHPSGHQHRARDPASRSLPGSQGLWQRQQPCECYHRRQDTIGWLNEFLPLPASYLGACVLKSHIELTSELSGCRQAASALVGSGQHSSMRTASSFLTLKLCLSGFIIQAIFNFLLIILSGSRTALNMSYGEDRDVGVATYPAKTRPNSPAATNGAPQVTVVSP